VRRRRRKKVSNKWWWASSSAVVLMVGFKYGSRALKASRLFFLACFSFFFFFLVLNKSFYRCKEWIEITMNKS
jgi:hypothetical protein